jgi:hypothetical protein
MSSSGINDQPYRIARNLCTLTISGLVESSLVLVVAVLARLSPAPTPAYLVRDYRTDVVLLPPSRYAHGSRKSNVVLLPPVF